jgi:hypothetical protein
VLNSQSAKPSSQPVIRSAAGGLPLPKALVKVWGAVFAHRLIVYIGVLLITAVGAYGYWVRTHTIFACQANGYSADRYLAYCSGPNYADYEHGAFQFNLEPGVEDSVRNADVMFLGNSRVQVAFSTDPTGQWFSANSARYYLLGFSYYENAFFEGKLLQRIHPHADVYVINADDFFDLSESLPIQMITHDPNALKKYREKRLWQHIHERACSVLTVLCGKQFAIFRSRSEGTYHTEGAVAPKTVPVSYDPAIDKTVADQNIKTAIGFLSRVTQDKCVILTIVPYVGTKIGIAQAVASGVGLKLVTPGALAGLHTYDGYHLDQPSAQRWSQAFLEVAGPEIRSCLDKRNAPARQAAGLPVPSVSAITTTNR